MTTFEIIVTVAIIAIVLLLLVIVIQFGVFLQRDGVFSVLVKMSSIEEKLENINGEVGQTNARIDGFIPWARLIRQKAESLENAWACDITTIIDALRRLENCLTQDINWGELTDNQKSEILYRLTHPVIESPFKPPFNPTCETTNKED